MATRKQKIRATKRLVQAGRRVQHLIDAERGAKESAAQMAERLQSAALENEQLRERIKLLSDEAVRTSAAVEASVEKFEAAVSELEQTLNELRLDRSNLQEAIVSLTAEGDELRARLRDQKSLKVEVRRQRVAIVELKRQLTEAQTERDLAKAKLGPPSIG